MDVPSKIGRYGVTERVGESRSSVVSKGWDEPRNAEVVVKIIQESDDRFATRVLRDLERWVGLGVDGMQPILEVGRESGYVWYAAEPVGYRSLQSEIDAHKTAKEKFTEKQIFQVGKKLATALEGLHGLHVQHGNLKPSNVLGSLLGELVLADVGLVRAVEFSELPSHIDSLQEYRHMSPDQLLELKPLDERSDVYQLGLILYEMATLVHPCAKVQTPADIRDRMAKPPDAPSKLDPKFDRKLSAAIMKCLARERDQRFTSVKDFARAWASTTAKYQSLTDHPPAALPEADSPQRKTQRFAGIPRASGPSQRISGRNRMPPDPSIREIKQTPMWQVALMVSVLAAGVGAGGWFLYTQEAHVRIDGAVTQEPAFAGAKLIYKTNRACESAVVVTGDGAPRTLKNAKDGETKQHTVIVDNLAAGKKYQAAVQLGPQGSSEPFALDPAPARPIFGVKIAPGADGLAISFKTTAKARSVLRARVDDKQVEQPVATDPDTSHETVLKGVVVGKVTYLMIEATDREGTKRTIDGAGLATQVIEPLAKAIAAPPFAAGPLPDAVAALEKAGIGGMLADLAALGTWPFEAPDVSAGQRSELYRTIGSLERALGRAQNPGTELPSLAPIRENPHYRGQVVSTSEVARYCAGLSKAPPATPSSLLAQLGLFSKLKPGTFTSPSARTRVSYDPMPKPAEVSNQSQAKLHLPAPPKAEYASALLIVAVSALPKDGILVVESSAEPREFVLYSPASRPGAFPGEQFVARALPAALIAGGPLELTIRAEPLVTMMPPPFRVLGALVVFK